MTWHDKEGYGLHALKLTVFIHCFNELTGYANNLIEVFLVFLVVVSKTELRAEDCGWVVSDGRQDIQRGLTHGCIELTLTCHAFVHIVIACGDGVCYCFFQLDTCMATFTVWVWSVLETTLMQKGQQQSTTKTKAGTARCGAWVIPVQVVRDLHLWCWVL